WSLEQELLPAVGSDEAHSFGGSVGISGDWIGVGTWAMRSPAGITGGAVVYHRGTDGIWTQTQHLIASDAAYLDQAGESLAMTEDTLAVGAPGRNSSRGAVFVYRRQSDNTWLQEAELSANDSLSGDFLGISVAIDGDLILAGASQYPYNGGR